PAHAGALSDVATDGDIILHKSRSSQAAALRAATGSPYTHVGLVFERDGTLQVLEAVEPVKWTPLDRWVARGRDEHVVVLRLRDPSRLQDGGAERLRASGERFLGRHYDTLFQWSDERIYCSELVTKAYTDALGVTIGELATFGDFDLSAPEVQALIQARTAGRLDAKEVVVSPASYLADDDLAVVFSTDPAIRVAE